VLDRLVILLDDVIEYLLCRISIPAPESARMLTIAAVLAPLLSIVVLSATPCISMARSKKRRAAAQSRRAGQARPRLHFITDP
jgi:hypothetical protein